MKIAICPGSFDPVTKGHVDILERSSKLFDKVIAVVLVNPAKTPTFTTEERVELIKKSLINKKLNPELETLFMVTNQEHMYLSSTLVRQIAEFGGDIDMFVPEEIKDILKAKMIKEK